MMYVRGFKGCLQCGCELKSGFGSWICGHNLGRRTLRQVLVEALEVRPDGPEVPAPHYPLPLHKGSALSVPAPHPEIPPA